MIAQAQRRRLAREVSADRERLKARTQEVLSREIGFVPNPAFRKMDAARFWRKELILEADPSDTVSVTSDRLPMPVHLERMTAAPLLTPAQERDLFCRMNYLKYRANSMRSTLNASRPSLRKLAAIEQLLTKADQLRNRVVSSNTRLVMSIVKKFADDSNPFDDLLSEGIACLMKAVEKFDFSRGFRFSTYATMAVRREVIRLMNRTRRDHARFSSGHHEILHRQVHAVFPAERSESALTQLNTDMKRMLSRLDDREQFIVKARFGFTELGKKPTFSNLGEDLGISKERVRQLEIRAMNKLRHLVDELQLGELKSLADVSA